MAGNQQRRPRDGGAPGSGPGRLHRRGRPSSHSPKKPPDLGNIARDAVASYLHDASMGLADQSGPAVDSGIGIAGNLARSDGAIALAEPATSPVTTPAANDADAESVAWRAAAAGVATLDRIEAAAARVEADIADALRAQETLRDGAATAAEAAVRSAQSSWVAAGHAVEAESRAHVWLRRTEHCVTVTVALLVIAIVILVLTAVGLH
jgi:hypothetical protein